MEDAINVGDIVTGKDLSGKEVVGEVKNVMNVFQIASIKIGKDRLDFANCNISDLKKL